MALKDDYQAIAKRAISASNETRKIQEKSAFLSYHAFESTGCALADHNGDDVGQRVKHHDKINLFRSAALIHCDSTEQLKIATVAVTLINLRNKLLYPNFNQTTSSYTLPETVITQAQSNSLRNDVREIIQIVDKKI